MTDQPSTPPFQHVVDEFKKVAANLTDQPGTQEPIREDLIGYDFHARERIEQMEADQPSTQGGGRRMDDDAIAALEADVISGMEQLIEEGRTRDDLENLVETALDNSS